MQDISKILLTLVQLFLQYVWVANLFFIIVIIMIEKKNPLYTILWIFLLTLMPYVGFFIYLFFGLTFKKKRVANKIYKIKKLKSRKDVSKSDNEELKRFSHRVPRHRRAFSPKIPSPRPRGDRPPSPRQIPPCSTRQTPFPAWPAPLEHAPAPPP